MDVCVDMPPCFRTGHGPKSSYTLGGRPAERERRRWVRCRSCRQQSSLRMAAPQLLSNKEQCVRNGPSVTFHHALRPRIIRWRKAMRPMGMSRQRLCPTIQRLSASGTIESMGAGPVFTLAGPSLVTSERRTARTHAHPLQVGDRLRGCWRKQGSGRVLHGEAFCNRGPPRLGLLPN